MIGPKRTSWSEADVLAMPAGEHDYFDRKSGALLTSQDFRSAMGKALSAMANSGGGHILIGVEDNGDLAGVIPLHGKTATREWLEQIIPNLVAFPLEDFRVHEVVPSIPSTIGSGMVVLVVDVGDSVLAPHQSASTRTYYYREGGHSKPAPHFYLETLRNRLISPTLEAAVEEVRPTAAYQLMDDSNSIFVETRLRFVIRNTGRIAAYKWALIIEGVDGEPEDRSSHLHIRLNFRDFPRGNRVRNSSLSLDETILPGLDFFVERDFGFLLQVQEHDRDVIVKELKRFISSEFQMRFRIVTETSRGETNRSFIAPLVDYESFVDEVQSLLRVS